MATAPRRTALDPESPAASPSIAPESQDETLALDAAADRSVDAIANREVDPIDPVGLLEGHDHPSPERIAAEAYAIYLAGGQRDGNDLEDWLEAERRLRLRREAGTIDG
jgi:hypothetical protein